MPNGSGKAQLAGLAELIVAQTAAVNSALCAVSRVVPLG